MKFSIKNVFLAIVLLLSISIILVFTKKYLFTTSKNNSDLYSQQNNTSLTGQIIYKKNNSIVAYNLIAKTETKLIENLDTVSNSDIWKQSNDYIFSTSGNTEILRKNIVTSEQSVIIVKNDDCFSKPKVDSYCDVSNIYPSVDGKKLIYILEGGSGDKFGGMTVSPDYTIILFIHNFDTNITKIITKSSEIIRSQNIKWFNDNRFLYLGNKTFLDTDNYSVRTMAELNTDVIYPSFTGHRFLWFDESVKAKERGNGIFEVSRPNMVNSSLSEIFNIKNNQDSSSEAGIPFIKFPVVARDFKSISNVIAIKKASEFLVEIESGGKKDIFLTDSGGTFKKLNPNNSDSYKLVTYLPVSKQVLAIRSKEDRSYGVKVLESQIVLLDESNYAEFVANIDNGPIVYKEKSILKFETPDFFNYISNRFAISPDNKFLLLPLQKERENFKKYTVINLESGHSQSLDNDFGQNFIWLQDVK
mgnify:CR=1 FL=1